MRYEHQLAGGQTPAQGAVPLVKSYVDEVVSADLHRLALDAGRLSRFAADPYMPAGTMERMYSIWIRRSVTREIADDVLVTGAGGDAIGGFISVARVNDPGIIALIAVDPAHQRQGIGRALMRAAEAHFLRSGVSQVVVTTQDSNLSACALYEGCGYRRAKTVAAVHFWL